MLYYHPSAPQAYADTKDLQFVVSSGLFLRNLHRWSAHAMVFLVFAHMFACSTAARTARRASSTG
jgi:quinol-cytochrome oxidoreductase complex cytochrome b subunit